MGVGVTGVFIVREDVDAEGSRGGGKLGGARF